MSISTRVSIAWPPSIPPSEETDTLILSFPSNYFIDLRPLKSLNALDWGMAGYSVTTETSEGKRIKFIHEVDSRAPHNPLSVQDEGLFKQLENGDELETGKMVNPSTGVLMAYEEIWRRLAVAEKEVVLLESVGDSDKTFLGRIGIWFQGIGTTEGKVHAIRAELKSGEWETVFVFGDRKKVPLCSGTEGWRTGDVVQVGNRWWTVRHCEL